MANFVLIVIHLVSPPCDIYPSIHQSIYLNMYIMAVFTHFCLSLPLVCDAQDDEEEESEYETDTDDSDGGGPLKLIKPIFIPKVNSHSH